MLHAAFVFFAILGLLSFSCCLAVASFVAWCVWAAKVEVAERRQRRQDQAAIRKLIGNKIVEVDR